MATIGRPKERPDVLCICQNPACGVEYQRPASSKTGKRFCSLSCYSAYRRGRPRPDRRVTPMLVRCPTCGHDFATGGRAGRRYGAKFCSRACQASGQSVHAPIRQMSSEEVAWLAGLFDGEGGLAWPRKGSVHQVRLTITNTNFALLQRVVAVTGTGTIGSRRKRSNPRHADAANWSVYGQRAHDLLSLMMPWLIVKLQNAEIVLTAVAQWKAGERTTLVPVQPRLRLIKAA